MGSNDWWRPEDGAQTGPATLPLLSKQRIEDILRKNEWAYETDDDGDLSGVWDSWPFWFVLHGENKEILQIVCRCTRDFEPDQLQTLQRELDDWNREKLWPRAYYRTHPDTGELSVFGDNVIDHEMGLTDDQLEQHIRCSIGTGLEMCQHFAGLAEE